VTGNDIVGVVTGEARDIARVFLVVHLAFTAAFAVALRRAAARRRAGRP
jgi:hypothetical protein